MHFLSICTAAPWIDAYTSTCPFSITDQVRSTTTTVSPRLSPRQINSYQIYDIEEQLEKKDIVFWICCWLGRAALCWYLAVKDSDWAWRLCRLSIIRFIYWRSVLKFWTVSCLAISMLHFPTSQNTWPNQRGKAEVKRGEQQIPPQKPIHI